MVLAVFDIGGTNIKYGIGSLDGELIADYTTPTEAIKGGRSLIRKIKRLTEELQREWGIKGVAISTAGSIDSKSGTVIYATETIPGYTGMRVKEILEKDLGLPVELENDVHCSSLGELWKGSASSDKDLLFLTLGTGIGGTLVADGQIQKGSSQLAGGIGHMNLYPQGILCSCGQKGCFEQYASAKSLHEKALQFDPTIHLPEFMERVRRGESRFAEIFHDWLSDLALGIQSLIYIWNPAMVVIGGGISAQGKWLEQEIESAVLESLLPHYKNSIKIRLAKNGNRSNMVGAIKNFHEQQMRRGEKNGHKNEIGGC